MARPSEADILGLLRELHAHGVEFVVVGGAAAVMLRLHGGETYADLAPRTVACEVDDLTLRLIDLPALVAIKSSTGRARDRIVVPLLLDILRRTQG